MVVLSVDCASSRLLFVRWISPLFSLVCIAFAFNMYTLVCPVDVLCFSRIGVQSKTPSPHRGARCSSSLSEYFSGWHWFRICLVYSFGGRFVGIYSRRLALIPSTSLEAALRLIAMWLGACRLGVCSNSTLAMFRTYNRTRGVRSLA